MKNTNWYKDAIIYQIYPRSFCDANKGIPIEEVERLFIPGMRAIRALEKAVEFYTPEQFELNRKGVVCIVNEIANGLTV